MNKREKEKAVRDVMARYKARVAVIQHMLEKDMKDLGGRVRERRLAELSRKIKSS